MADLATVATVELDTEDCDFLNTMAERSMRGREEWGEERVREMCARARVDIVRIVVLGGFYVKSNQKSGLCGVRLMAGARRVVSLSLTVWGAPEGPVLTVLVTDVKCRWF